jgi:hypothetical protein
VTCAVVGARISFCFLYFSFLFFWLCTCTCHACWCDLHVIRRVQVIRVQDASELFKLAMHIIFLSPLCSVHVSPQNKKFFPFGFLCDGSDAVHRLLTYLFYVCRLL